MGLKAPILCKHEAKSKGETMIHRKDYRSYCIPKILTKKCKIVIQYYCGKLVITTKMFGRLFIHKLKDVLTNGLLISFHVLFHSLKIPVVLLGANF